MTTFNNLDYIPDKPEETIKLSCGLCKLKAGILIIAQQLAITL